MSTTHSGEELPRANTRPEKRPVGSPYRNVPDKAGISMLGIGIVIGVAIGAGIALLAAPQSGEDTRDNIRDRIRHLRGQDRPWDKLARELRRASALRRKHDLEGHRKEEQKAVDRQRAESDARVASL